MFILKILLVLEKCLSIRFRNLRPTLVFTFLLNGGLNHMFLRHSGMSSCHHLGMLGPPLEVLVRRMEVLIFAC